MIEASFKRTIMSLILGGIFIFYSVGNAENIDPLDDDSQYAYGENVGWLNFEPSPEDGACVTASYLRGYVWAENIGWINLSCLNTGYCDTVNFGVVNDGSGTLSGYAWGENVGWISFSCENIDYCSTVDYGVRIYTNGEFGGWAWGENIGWIHFQEISPVEYKVQTCWVYGEDDTDCDCLLNSGDNCPDTPNSPDLGTCTRGLVGELCMSDEECGTDGFCSMNQEDEDYDDRGDACDNCPNHPNGSDVSTCVKTEFGVTHSYRVGTPKQFITCDGNEDCTPTDGTCQMEPLDFNSNGCGDACECYADCCGTEGVTDGRVSTPDYSQLKIEFGRFDCAQNPCLADFNGDNRVSTPDYSILKQEFGRFDCPACP